MKKFFCDFFSLFLVLGFLLVISACIEGTLSVWVSLSSLTLLGLLIKTLYTLGRAPLHVPTHAQLPARRSLHVASSRSRHLGAA